jgi:hypothetical protein
MENWFYNEEDYLTDNMNEEGFFFKEHSEYCENSTSFKENNWSPQYKLKLISKHEEFHSYSNDNSDSPNIPTFKVNGENENLCKYNNGEDSTSQFDKNKENENNKNNNSTRENSNENKESNIEKVSQNLNIEEEVKREKTPKFRTKITTSNKPSYWRFDYAKKYWKSKITQNLIDCINEKISNSDLPIEYKNKIS